MILPEPVPIGPAAGPLKRWWRSDMRVLRWVFLALYLLIVAPTVVFYLVEGWGEWWLFLPLAGCVVAQAMLILGTGTIQLCRPIRKRRLLLPVAAAAFMLAVLLGGLCVAAWELFELDEWGFELHEGGFIALLLASWVVWGWLLFVHVRHRPRYRVLGRLTTILFTGSLLELLATVPSHVIVSRRPGCLVGIATMIGILAGLCVMLFAFGPMIALLFLRPRWRKEMGADGIPYCPACGYDLRASSGRCPECGLPIEAPPSVGAAAGA